MTFTFDTLPAGRFAATAVHDETGNRMIERNATGFPKEAVAFSNNQKLGPLAAPKFNPCQFPLAKGQKKKIVMTLDYPK